jgi:hypothetical protein
VGLDVDKYDNVISLSQETVEHPDPWMDNEGGATTFPEDWTKKSSRPYDWQQDQDFKVAAKSSPNDEDKQITPVHLLDTVIHNIRHVDRHLRRFIDPEVQKDPKAIQFNFDHAIKHLGEVEEHIQKIVDHLKETDISSKAFQEEGESFPTISEDEGAIMESKESRIVWRQI